MIIDIGIDLDGTMTAIDLKNQNIRLPLWLCVILAPFTLFIPPRKAVIKKIQLMHEQGYRFVIITRRYDHFFCVWFTRLWLMLNHVPFIGLFCVGFEKGSKERKLKIIRDEKVNAFVDSNQSIIDFMEKNSVHAVASLDEVK
ncbi:MAG: hypothetical protein ABH841_02845 [Candidatus Nealsonbacteria bacterium]